jgi:hypothetical protein
MTEDRPVREEADLFSRWEPVELGPAGREALGTGQLGRAGDSDSRFGQDDDPWWMERA